MTCLRPTQLCGGEQTKRKSFNFLILVHSQLCGGGQTKRKSFDFLLLVHSQLCGGGQTKRKLFNFLLLAHSLKRKCAIMKILFTKGGENGDSRSNHSWFRYLRS